jgi:hypothetical protein
MNFPPNLAWCSIQEENSFSTSKDQTRLTTLLFTLSQAQTAAFPKGGKPSSVGKYFST